MPAEGLSIHLPQLPIDQSEGLRDMAIPACGQLCHTPRPLHHHVSRRLIRTIRARSSGQAPYGRRTQSEPKAEIRIHVQIGSHKYARQYGEHQSMVFVISEEHTSEL